MHTWRQLQAIKDSHFFDYLEWIKHSIIQFFWKSCYSDVFRRKSDKIIDLIFHLFAMFVDLLSHCRSDFFHVLLTEFQQLLHSIDDVINLFCFNSLTSWVIIRNIRAEAHSWMKAFIHVKERHWDERKYVVVVTELR